MKKTEGIFEKKIIITGKQCGGQGTLSAAALASLLELTASDHLRQYGLGAESMRKKGLLWILVKRSVEIYRLPACGEEVLLQTWTGKERNWLFPKYFRMMDSSGTLLLEASCLWALMDEKTRSLTSPDDSLAVMPVMSLTGEMKLPAWSVSFPELEEQAERTVSPAQIDYNSHMNNAWYLEWAESVLEEDFRKTYSLKSIWIEYSRELREGQTLKLKFSLVENSLFIRGVCQGEPVFSARLKYGR